MRAFGTRRQLALGILVAVLGVLTLNVLGLLRYPGGPFMDENDTNLLWLDIPPANQGYSKVTTIASDSSAVGLTIYSGWSGLTNKWPFVATVESITPLEATPGLVIDQVWLGKPDGLAGSGSGFGPTPNLPDGVRIEDRYAALPAAVGSVSSPDGYAPILLVLHGDQPGPAGYRGLQIDYRVGPFTFRVTQHTALALCLGPLPAGVSCPSD